MNDKLKFYRETLVEMTKEAYRKKPKELKTEEAVEEGELLTKTIMKQVDEYEKSFNYQTQIIENPKVTCTNSMWTGPASGPSFIDLSSNSVKQMVDSVKDSMRTIVDNGPQYQANQKPYGTLGEHWKELMELFRIKVQLIDEWKSQFAIVINNLKNGRQAVDRLPSKLDDIYKKLGIEFIEDFVKACEKCEE